MSQLRTAGNARHVLAFLDQMTKSTIQLAAERVRPPGKCAGSFFFLCLSLVYASYLANTVGATSPIHNSWPCPIWPISPYGKQLCTTRLTILLEERAGMRACILDMVDGSDPPRIQA